MRRTLAACAILAATAVLAGCRPQGASQPIPSPSPVSVETPAGYSVARVDVGEALKAHRRWPELEALNKKMAALEARLGSPLPPPEVPDLGAALDAELKAEAERLQALYRGEMKLLEEQAKQRMEAFANDIRAENEAKIADRHRAINAELQRAVDGKRDELQKELERFELAAMAEYRIPLLNLRLKGDVVGLANEEEAKRITAEAERFTTERDGKIRAKSQSLEKAFQEFQQARVSEAEAQLKTMGTSLNEDAEKRVAARQQEIQAEMKAAVKSREEAFQRAMEEKKKILAGGAEAQMRSLQERYLRRVQSEAGRFQQELGEVAEQRFRLEYSMIADVRIEVATIAQERRFDLVLSRAVAAPGAADLTKDVIARLRGSQ